MNVLGRKSIVRCRGSGLSNPPKLSFHAESQELLWLATGLRSVASSPTQNTVAVMLSRHG